MADPLRVPNIPDDVRRLLIIRQSALGDIVNALYSLPAIRKAYPGARLAWVVDDRFRDLFDAVEGVDEVIVFPRRRWGPWVARPWRWPLLALEWNRYKRSLREMEFDMAVDLQGSLKSRLTLKSVRASDVFRYRRGPAPDLCDLPSVDGIQLRPEDPSRDLRATQFGYHLLDAGVRPFSAPFPWKIPETATRTVDDHLQSEGLPPRAFALLHPGSSAFGRYKRWPEDRFAALADRLSASGTPVLVTWGPGERDLAARVVDAAGKGGAGVRLAPETRPLAVLIALLARAGVFVGNDSGPLHLASACGTPTVGLYGPKDPTVYAPCSPPRAVLYRPLPCSPCGSRQCGNPECMKALSVDDVFDATRALLQDRVDRPFRGIPLRRTARQAQATARDESGRRLAVDAPAPEPGPYRYFTTGSWQWTVRAGETGPLADAAMRSAEGLPGTLVRENPRRRFLRARLSRFAPDGSVEPTSGRDVFVKVYPVRSMAQRLRSWIGRSQADVEFARLSLLHDAGAPVPAPIARGRGPGTEAVILEDLGEVPTVRDVLQGELAEGDRRALMRELADAVAALHDTGFIHADLHAGNLLRPEPGSIRIIDVQRGYSIPQPGIPDRALTLAHLLFSLIETTRTSERCRILRRYADRLGWEARARRVLLVTVRETVDRLRRRYVMRQMRRARRGGSRIGVGRYRDGLLRTAEGVSDWMDQPESTESIVKDEAGRRILKAQKAGRILAIKEESRRPRGLREWVGVHGWRAAGLPAPRPCFLFVPDTGPARLASEWADGACPVNLWTEDRLRRGATTAWRRDLAWRLGRFIRRIHDAGIHHADLKAGNVLAREREGMGAGFLALDLDRLAVHPGPIPLGPALCNLAQLNASFAPPVTRSDRLRCFFAYAARDPALRRGWKAVVRSVMRKTISRRHRWPK